MEGDFHGLGDGVAVDAATDGGEGEGAEIVLAGESEAALIATGEELGLVVGAAVPDGAYGVEDVAGGEAVPLGELGLAGFAAAEEAARVEEFGAGGAVDGAIYASAAEERAVGGVDDGVDGEGGDVDFLYADAVGHDVFLTDRARTKGLEWIVDRVRGFPPIGQGAGEWMGHPISGWFTDCARTGCDLAHWRGFWACLQGESRCGIRL